jgi:hypothetical protein
MAKNTWGISTMGIRNFNLRKMSSEEEKEEKEDCFEPVINIHRHLLSATHTLSFLFALFQLKQKSSYVEKNRGHLPPLFSSTKLLLLDAACIHVVLPEYVIKDLLNDVNLSYPRTSFSKKLAIKFCKNFFLFLAGQPPHWTMASSLMTFLDHT